LFPLPGGVWAGAGWAYETDISSKTLIKNLLEANDIEWDEFIEI